MPDDKKNIYPKAEKSIESPREKKMASVKGMPLASEQLAPAEKVEPASQRFPNRPSPTMGQTDDYLGQRAILPCRTIIAR